MNEIALALVIGIIFGILARYIPLVRQIADAIDAFEQASRIVILLYYFVTGLLLAGIPVFLADYIIDQTITAVSGSFVAAFTGSWSLHGVVRSGGPGRGWWGESARHSRAAKKGWRRSRRK